MFVMFATQGTALIVEIIIGIATIVAFAAGSIKWLVKHYFAEIKSELKPNSGSSLKDQVTRLERNQKDSDEQTKEMRNQTDHLIFVEACDFDDAKVNS